MKRAQSIESVRWDLALRYRLIETVAWWEGRLTTGHLMQSFGISRQQASKDINTYINQHAPENLVYDKRIKGYVPNAQFAPLFIDDSASAYLHLLNQNHERAHYIEGLALAYAHTEVLQVPDRSIRPEVLRPLLKACREGLRLECDYVSFSTPNGETRLIAPHTLVYTGMRWHVRAYCERNREYRDFVLSRFRGTPDLMADDSEHGRDGDDGWNTAVQVIIEADSRLKPEQQAIIESDYGMLDGQLVIDTHGALVQYVLQRYQIDPNKVHAKATAQQIVVSNLDDLKQWLYQ
ncbi:MAG: WYL domain-containing protein [Pseudomonas sp.]|uniref:helix-turn-helix transcriptional regulator n=1 Tax=Pseudomonas sp. TaxID=306 RepID=UPI00299D50C3|nr:WYL domain-containing protein [Pseudomonas sp.]MDX1725148.1 WYL domain-containing protein [Pseudomonas sp.]